LIRLTRIDNSAHAAAYTLLGAYLAADPVVLLTPPVLLAATVVALVVAFGFVINDFHDVEVDRLSKPDRPVPSGRVSRRDCGLLALALAAAALLVATRLGQVFVVLALATILMSTAYSFWLKRTLLLGNLAMALLDSTIIVYGGLAAGGLPPAIWIVSCLMFIYIVAQEIMYTIDDQRGDALAAQRTTANRLGRGGALRLARILLLAFVAAALLPWFLGLASERYLYAIILCSVLPALGVVYVASPSASDRTVSVAVRVMKAVWLTSLVPVFLLR
jgi:geranylgeranylglycerol-phosphate geranylgeranyltransferase